MVTGVDESGGEARAYLADDTMAVKIQRSHRKRCSIGMATAWAANGAMDSMSVYAAGEVMR